jgi:tetratricopeptide (TPR) repeat protein
VSSDESRLATAAYKCGQLSEAIDLCERGITRAQANGEQEEFWRLRVLLSLCLCAKGEFAGSVALLDAVPVSEEVSTETRARVLNQRGFGLSRSCNFAGAKDALDAAQGLATAAGSPALVAEIEINRSTLFFYLAKYYEVETCARIALEIGEELKLRMIQASACAGIGKSYMYRERQTEAIAWFERAMALYEKEDATAYADIMRSELGCCYFALHEDDKAFEYFTRALQVSRESGALASLHIDLANMGCLHLRRGEFAATISHFQEALQIARKLGDEISVSKWLQNLASAYSQMGNPALSAGLQKQSEELAKTVEASRARAAT